MSNLMLSDLIRNTRQLAQGNARSPVNTLAEQKLAADTTAVFNYPITGAQVGATVEIGWVLYTVVDVDTTARTLTVLPEIDGTAADAAVGARATMRPRYPVRQIVTELNADLADLSGQGLYKLRKVADTDGVIAVPADALVVLAAWDEDGFKFRNPDAMWDHPTEASELSWKGHLIFGCTFSDFSYTTDADADTVGLTATIEDLPPLGAAIRLLAGAEAQRNLIDTQGDTRRAEEVPMGALTGSLRNLAALRQSRLVTEVLRIQQRYGLKLHEAI